MKASDVFKILNKGKRKETFIPKQDNKKKTLTVELIKYTGRSVINKVKQEMEGMKESLHIVFAPVQHFTKKMLEGVKRHELEKLTRIDPPKGGTSTLHDKSNNSTRSIGSKDDEFINWFDIGNCNEEVQLKKDEKNSVITLTKYDGSKTTLSEDLDKLLF